MRLKFRITSAQCQEQKYLSSISSGKGCRPRGFVRLLPAASVRDLALLIESHDAQPFLSSARSCPPLPGHRPCCLSGFPACRSSDYRPYLPQGVLACCPSGHRHSTSRQEAWPAVHPTPAVPPGVPPVRAALLSGCMVIGQAICQAACGQP